MLLSMSFIGQGPPCMHAAALSDDENMSMAMTMPMSHGDVAISDVSSPDSPSHSHTPAHRHAPELPGCAQLMACGLAVQLAPTNTVITNDAPLVVAAPSGPVLQYSSADLEVESPPPRS